MACTCARCEKLVDPKTGGICFDCEVATMKEKNMPIMKHFKFEPPSPLEEAKKHSSGKYVCLTCNKIADEENNKPECHRCSDWGGCGKNCTLSAVICTTCNIREEI